MKAKETARYWLELSDRELLDQCDIDLYRASGPGGQKRNKTSSAVRLRHSPSGLIVIAEDSRSQHENRDRALRRLRQAIALTQRNPIRPAAELPDFYRAALGRDPSLHVNPRHPDYDRIIQFVLDTFTDRQGSVADTAQALRISTGQLIRFLKQDGKLWEQANRMRTEFGLAALR